MAFHKHILFNNVFKVLPVSWKVKELKPVPLDYITYFFNISLF